MKTHFPLLSALLGLLLAGCATAPRGDRIVYVGVIGGMMRSGLWPELAKRFEKETGYKTDLAAWGNRDLIAESLRSGEIDFAAIHAGDVATNLVLDGFAKHMRVWTRNEFVIIGPNADPAHIRGLHDGALALRRIAATQSPWVDFQNSGPRDLTAALWKKAGLQPNGNWLLQTDSGSSEEALQFAHGHHAYLVLGRVPRLPPGMEILAQNDPEMQRAFVLLEANPRQFPKANARGARALAEFLLSPPTQAFLLQFAASLPEGLPLFYPIKEPDSRPGAAKR